METVQCWNRRAENPAGHYSFACQFFVTLWEPSYWPPAPFPRIYSFIEMNLALLIFSNRRVAVLRKKSVVTCSLNTVVHDSKYILIFYRRENCLYLEKLEQVNFCLCWHYLCMRLIWGLKMGLGGSSQGHLCSFVDVLLYGHFESGNFKVNISFLPSACVRDRWHSDLFHPVNHRHLNLADIRFWWTESSYQIWGFLSNPFRRRRLKNK